MLILNINQEMLLLVLIIIDLRRFAFFDHLIMGKELPVYVLVDNFINLTIDTIIYWVHKAYGLIDWFEALFNLLIVDLVLSIHDVDESQVLFFHRLVLAIRFFLKLHSKLTYEHSIKSLVDEMYIDLLFFRLLALRIDQLLLTDLLWFDNATISHILAADYWLLIFRLMSV